MAPAAAAGPGVRMPVGCARMTCVQIEDAMRSAQEAAAPEVGRGRLAEYIPSLAAVDPEQFGMAMPARWS